MCIIKVIHLVVSIFEQRLKRQREFGFLSRSHRACEAGFDTFEKIKCIFSIVLVEILEKSQVVKTLIKRWTR